MKNSLFDFTKIKFPSFDYLKTLYMNQEPYKLLLFDLGIFGAGFLRCFEDGYPEIQFIASFRKKKDHNNNFSYKLTTLEEYEWFKKLIIAYCNDSFKIDFDCSEDWP